MTHGTARRPAACVQGSNKTARLGHAPVPVQAKLPFRPATATHATPGTSRACSSGSALRPRSHHSAISKPISAAQDKRIPAGSLQGSYKGDKLLAVAVQKNEHHHSSFKLESERLITNRIQISEKKTVHLSLARAPAVPQAYVPLRTGDEVFRESFPSHPNCLQYKITLGQRVIRIRDSAIAKRPRQGRALFPLQHPERLVAARVHTASPVKAPRNRIDRKRKGALLMVSMI